VDGACRAPQPWGLSWITAMFLHGGGFIFGMLAARLLAGAGQAASREQWRSTA